MTVPAYRVMRTRGSSVMLRPESRERLEEVDSVVFDCDGVLVDARKSYDVVILKTAEEMIEGFSGVMLPLMRAGGELMLNIRATGGFNDDWDTTYAIAIFGAASLGPSEQGKMLGPGRTGRTLSRLRSLVRSFAAEKRLEGRASVDRFLNGTSSKSAKIDEMRQYLDSPTDAIHSRMTRRFDEMYYGESLFRRIYGTSPTGKSGTGLIEKERVLITGIELERLQRILGSKRMAIATGRPKIAVKHTLGRLLSFFDEDASVFIGDMDLNPELGQELSGFRKPSGASLTRASKMLSSKTLLYLGDSAEDRLMVEDARRTQDGIYFGGVYGVSFSQRIQADYFRESGADMVMRRAGSTPDILERLRR